MIIAQYFVEFIFYSFLGWVWESVYCTAKEKKWADRGFLFGPVCPIYGSCVVAASIVFSFIPGLADPAFPVWGIFIICAIGSAIAEFGTSWVLDKRFHARWWDYSKVPFNLQGRICLPVSVAFGVAGVLVVKYLIPFINGMHSLISPTVYEIVALIFAMGFGADFALTEASLSALLKNVERMHNEFNVQAQQNYEKISAAQNAVTERVHAEVAALSFNQKRILKNIVRFTAEKNKTLIQNANKQELIASLKEVLRKEKEKQKETEEV